MRETCARVLAAALMTGAIAFALGAPALFESPREQIQSLTAPPSSLQRSVFVAALPAPKRPRPAERLVTAHSVTRASTPAAVVQTAREGVSRKIPRTLAAARRPKPAQPPKPKAAPATDAANLMPPPAPAAAPPAVEVQDEGEEADDDDGDKKQDKDKEKRKHVADDDDDDDRDEED